MNAIVAVGAMLLGSAAASAEFPQPEALAPNVRFWEGIYSEWRTDQAVFHDRARLDLVFEVVELGPLGLYPVPDDPEERKRRAEARMQLIDGRRLALEDALRALEARQAEGTLDPAALAGLEAELHAAFAEAGALDLIPGAAERLRWQYGLADQFQSGLDRFDAWSGLLRPRFEDTGVPVDLLALAFVESLFNPAAVSHVGASGIFQFMPATGREMGLMRNDHWDERNDPLRAAAAAARLLKRNHERLGSWPLAITAYNHGPTGVARAVKAVGSTDLVDLIERHDARTWGFASKNFYAEFLAARRVLARRAELFGDWVAVPPHEVEEVRLPRPVALAALEAAGCAPPDTLRPLNPALLTPVRQGAQPVPTGYPLRVPAASGGEAFVTCAVAAAVPQVDPDEVLAVTHDYRVETGDTLGRIARRHGTTVAALTELNRLGPDGFIFAGQLLRIPGRTGVARNVGGVGVAQPQP